MSDPDRRPAAPTRLTSPPDAPGWRTLFVEHYAGLCDCVLHLVGSSEVAEDVVQELFLHLWDTRGPHDAVRLNRRYLYVAVRNRALKYLRHQRVAAASSERVSRESPPYAATPEDLYLRAELRDAAQRAIAGLPKRCREIFVLRRRHHLAYQEIAARLGLSLGTVKSQMWHATVRLKQQLAPHLDMARSHTSLHASRLRVL
jgi:RNA polymerase sigma-70 factor (ECF subfamily)